MKKILFIIIAITLVPFLLLVGAFVIRTRVFWWYVASGEGMQPTLTTGERVGVHKYVRNFSNGDIIVFRHQRNIESNDDMIIFQYPRIEIFISRIIASGGQTINIDFDSGNVYVDGVLLEEDYILEEELRFKGDIDFPVRVLEGSFFVMGDNRNNSRDSRQIGVVHKSQIVGRVS